MKRQLERATVLETLGVLALACLVVGHFFEHPAWKAAAVAFLVVGLFVKPAANAIARLWLKFAEVVGAFNSRVLLGLIFFVFLTPIALLARIARGDVLHLKRRTGADRSYWQPRDHAFTAGDISKIW